MSGRSHGMRKAEVSSQLKSGAFSSEEQITQDSSTYHTHTHADD